MRAAFVDNQTVGGKERTIVISGNRQDRFFTATECDRCGGSLEIRTMSFFTHETICMACSSTENEIKQRIKAKGVNPDLFEGCGKVPEA